MTGVQTCALPIWQGTASLYIHQPGSALNTINPKWKTILETENKRRWNENIIFSGDMITVKTTTLDALIAKHGVPDMIKIDVEGHEKNVLNGLSQPVKFISFEVLLPEFLTDALYCLDRLMALNEATRFNYAVEEKTALARFISYPDFKKMLCRLSIPHLEVIAMVETLTE